MAQIAKISTMAKNQTYTILYVPSYALSSTERFIISEQ